MKTIRGIALALFAFASAWSGALAQSPPFNAYSIATLGGGCANAGAVPYQSIGGVTVCLNAGVDGQVLKLAGGVPTWATVTGTGTVSSVDWSLPSIFAVSGGPITTSGTLTATLASQTANSIFATPVGTSGVPLFRLMVASDMPANQLRAGQVAIGTSDVSRLDIRSNATTRWSVQPTGEFTPGAASAYDIGASATRVKTIYTGGIDANTITANTSAIVPTRPANDNSTNAASTAYVDAAVIAGTSGAVPSTRTLSVSRQLTIGGDAGGSGDLSANRSFDLNSALFTRGLFGLEPEKISGTVLGLQPGSVYDNAGGTGWYSTTSQIRIDLATVGANGIDTGSAASGTSYQVYILKNNSTNALAGIVSASITYGGVTVPSGYTLIRKLPWGFIYNTAAGWGVSTGIPDFHLSYWPKPYTSYTAYQMAAPFVALSGGTAATFTSVDLSGYAPDSARYVKLQARVSYVSAAGSCYIRTYGTQSTGIIAGSAYSSGQSVYQVLDIRTTSGAAISYKCDAGVSLTLGFMAYSQTEPT